MPWNAGELVAGLDDDPAVCVRFRVVGCVEQ